MATSYFNTMSDSDLLEIPLNQDSETTGKVFRAREVPLGIGLLGMSPEIFLSLLNFLKRYPGATSVEEEVMESKFCEQLMLSTGWTELSLTDALPLSGYKSGYLNFVFDGRNDLHEMCLCAVGGVIDVFTACGIRPSYIREFKPLHAHDEVNDESNYHDIQDIQKKWNEYRTFVPSLFLQCVREIRSALQLVTKEKLQQLPIPPLLQGMISLKREMKMLPAIKFHKLVQENNPW